MLSATGMEDTTKTQAAPCRAPVPAPFSPAPLCNIERCTFCKSRDERELALEYQEKLQRELASIETDDARENSLLRHELRDLKRKRLETEIAYKEEIIDLTKKYSQEAKEKLTLQHNLLSISKKKLEDHDAEDRAGRDINWQTEVRDARIELANKCIALAKKDLQMAKLEEDKEEWRLLYYSTQESGKDQAEQATKRQKCT